MPLEQVGCEVALGALCRRAQPDQAGPSTPLGPGLPEAARPSIALWRPMALVLMSTVWIVPVLDVLLMTTNAAVAEGLGLPGGCCDGRGYHVPALSCSSAGPPRRRNPASPSFTLRRRYSGPRGKLRRSARNYERVVEPRVAIAGVRPPGPLGALLSGRGWTSATCSSRSADCIRRGKTRTRGRGQLRWREAVSAESLCRQAKEVCDGYVYMRKRRSDRDRGAQWR